MTDKRFDLLDQVYSALRYIKLCHSKHVRYGTAGQLLVEIGQMFSEVAFSFSLRPMNWKFVKVS